MHNGIVVASVIYDSDTWKRNVELREEVDVYEISCLRPMRGVTAMD